MPDAFSPNGDGVNDEFRINANGFTEYEVIIYNRWGQVVFNSIDPAKGWNGTFNGKDCQEGIYAIYLRYKGRKTPMQMARGNLLLMRDK
jgi:gliding motility-associated-like protein